MNLHVVFSADQPLYSQIYDQIRFQILRGELSPGTPLPPIRTIAQELNISVISVKRAWEDLAREGYIEAVVGRGSTVKQLSREHREQLRKQVLEELLTPTLAACRGLGASREELLKAVQELYP